MGAPVILSAWARDRHTLWTAADFFIRAKRFAVLWDRYARIALRRYGSDGALVSGAVREHFPEHVKARLRMLARLASANFDAAWECRPPRVRNATMQKLWRSIKRQFPNSFYL